MKYLRVLFVVSFIVAIVNNKLSGTDILFHIVSLVLMLLITYSFSFIRHLGKYLVLLTYWVSLMFMPAFHLVKNLLGDEGYGAYLITKYDYVRILSFGSKVLFITCALWFLLGMIRTNAQYYPQYQPKPISTRFARFTLYGMFGLSFFSLYIGLSRMGVAGVVLPFHISGIITLLRVVFYPIVFAAIIENFILTKRHIPNSLFVLYAIWGLLETFVRLSKGALISSFLTVTILLLIYFRPNLKTLIKIGTPIILVYLFLYPIVEIMRSGDSNIKESVEIASSQNEYSSGEIVLQPLNRAFMIPHMYAKDYNYLDQNALFDFSRAKVILAWGGSARYQTFVIDDYPPGVSHSSGTTGIQDPLLFGGYGLCYIVIILIMLLAFVIDSMSKKRMYTVYITLILFLWSMCNEQNITSFTDSVGLQYIITRFIAIWIAYLMNFRNKTVLSSQ